ncbi:hypothetical protein MKZ87_21690 [Pseudomonas sp. MCal1]|uniref:hypothetical protein n=1 Tax=Pseudomonas sp. MCal1 TaxID=2919887 RepID=UPI00224E0DE4|nr:hypothetical protein [Pseudomonas sp. MCal1]MCX4220261.1 hypothetical protein [Pseudomonas sp. MCal1]
MNRITAVSLGLFMSLTTFVASASEAILDGKVTSKISAFIIRPDNLFVTDDKGGWFDQGLPMQQTGGWDSPYEVAVRLRITSSTGIFQVRMDNPLEIRNRRNPTQVFRDTKVSLAAEGDSSKLLAVGRNTQFNNPPPPNEDTDSVGYFTLGVSALPPTGSFKETAGDYSGELALTFEPVAREP